MKIIGILSAALPAIAVAQSTPPPRAIVAPGNPILADGRYYSADPAPVVDGDTLYVLAGRDEAPAGVNDFVMKSWQLLATADPASGRWRHYPGIVVPERVFAWAEPARAYAAQIVKGADGRFYLYAPVLERDSDADDKFAIGVAVADHPTGPWRDAHPAGPIISQQVPTANAIQNIDPTVLVDDDARVYIYWGTFGEMRGMELARDMTTPVGPVRRIEGLTGFFEAPWILKRRGTYYMLYAANDAGPDSACTPALYHACQAYGTAPSPMGPWTRRGVVLRPVSSTTSHAGAIEFEGHWYLVYHTADALGGGHFRRSVAIDRMEWDDRVTPAAIRRVVPTRSIRDAVPTRNIAPAATIAASNEPVPVVYRLGALNDGIVRAAPLPPDIWASGLKTMPAAAWIEYRWPRARTLTASRIRFFAGRTMASDAAIRPPAAWHLEYWNGGWKRIAGRPVVTADGYRLLRFAPITTRCLRAVFAAAGTTDRPDAIGVAEWETWQPAPVASAPAATPVAAGGCTLRRQ